MNLTGYVLMITLAVLTACSSSSGDPRALFQNGDYENSFRLFKERADNNNDMDAQNFLGIHYALGLGVERDYKEALKWYELAARKGNPDAQRNYGDMFQYGRGLPQDYYKAFIWYFAASQQGHELAKRSLENITDHNKLTPNQQMHAKLEANEFIPDPGKRFMSHDTYIENK